MKSMARMAKNPLSLPLVADDITELHAARLLLLLKYCGTSGKINGLTKLAKLDFFVRYPDFFGRAAASQGRNDERVRAVAQVDSAMVRHHYGPWDKRYYALLPYLEARQLITVSKVGGTYDFKLTELGIATAGRLGKDPSFCGLVKHMNEVKTSFGSWKGNKLKNLIYKLFREEVADKNLGEVIQ